MAGGNGGVAVEETPDFGIVVAGIEVVEPDFAVEDVAATADETSGEMQKSAKGGRAPFCAARFWMDREMENARHSPWGRQGFRFSHLGIFSIAWEKRFVKCFSEYRYFGKRYLRAGASPAGKGARARKKAAVAYLP